ncbi:MAG: GIY-YIG nuclease family protein [Planctomycetes bacterium]|nr:GIY-YIG nuclease family protein [Planctomycetota bacterium]
MPSRSGRHRRRLPRSDRDPPYTIRIFLPDGTPDGLKLIEKSNWTGQGVVCPRTLLTDKRGRPEFLRTGVYILVGTPEPGGLPTINVGQTDEIRTRLTQHQRKDFWDRAVFFTSKDGSLNRAHVLYLEARLLKLAREAKRAILDNEQLPEPPGLTEAEQADVDGFLEDILSVLPVVGLNVFEKAPQARKSKELLTLRAKGLEARGFEDAEGFVVVSGSNAAGETSPSMHDYLQRLRQDLIDQQVLVSAGSDLVFSQDYTFNSPSTAAGIIGGHSANGRVAWKDDRGRTLKELQEADARGNDPGNPRPEPTQ